VLPRAVVDQRVGCVKLTYWSPEQLVARLDDVLAVYSTAMEYPYEIVDLRRGFIAAHTQRSGFRAVATVGDDDELVGFGYGYHSRPGQWWHEQVRGGLELAAYNAWMSDCFELVELHVLPFAQGHGIGHAQLSALVHGVPHRTVMLSTPEGESRAWRLYRRMGFVDVLRHYEFLGDDRPFAVLGRTLPLTPA
jgi:ribosomal protein S18 acetylase RimI-like enzyme